jgi:hypothetical protein
MNLAELIAHRQRQLGLETLGQLHRRSEGTLLPISKPNLLKMADPNTMPRMPEPGTILGLAMLLDVPPLVVLTAIGVSHHLVEPRETLRALGLPTGVHERPSVISEAPLGPEDVTVTYAKALELIASRPGRGPNKARKSQVAATGKGRGVPRPRSRPVAVVPDAPTLEPATSNEVSRSA